jgi:polyribonucleotide nucleotidyltransferase
MGRVQTKDTMKQTQEITLNGKPFTFETGRLAKQADGSVMVRYADTMVLATVVCSRTPREGIDYFPLQVEYREKTAAAGKIPGGFFKRNADHRHRLFLRPRA